MITDQLCLMSPSSKSNAEVKPATLWRVAVIAVAAVTCAGRLSMPCCYRVVPEEIGHTAKYEAGQDERNHIDDYGHREQNERCCYDQNEQ